MEHSARERTFDRLELAASVAWLGMDFAWMEHWTYAALCLAVPTSLCSAAGVLTAEPSFAARAIAGAMASWAVMNCFWMMSDLDVYNGIWIARTSFALGVLLLLLALIVSGSSSAVMLEVARKFRRMRGPD